MADEAISPVRIGDSHAALALLAPLAMTAAREMGMLRPLCSFHLQ